MPPRNSNWHLRHPLYVRRSPLRSGVNRMALLPPPTCQIKERGALCRDLRDPDCDLKEYCNGTSTECTDDFYVQDGQLCEGRTGVCMTGVCQSPDRWCRKVFGKGNRNPPSPTPCSQPPAVLSVLPPFPLLVLYTLPFSGIKVSRVVYRKTHPKQACE